LGWWWSGNGKRSFACKLPENARKNERSRFMEQEYKEVLRRLFARLNSCYDEYHADLMLLDKGQLIESASEIIAVNETHMEICFWLELSMLPEWSDCFNSLIKGPMSRQDAIYLLSLENPLMDLALKWWFYTLGKKVDFHEFYRTERQGETD
jgi:hypothetical protein